MAGESKDYFVACLQVRRNSDSTNNNVEEVMEKGRRKDSNWAINRCLAEVKQDLVQKVVRLPCVYVFPSFWFWFSLRFSSSSFLLVNVHELSALKLVVAYTLSDGNDNSDNDNDVAFVDAPLDHARHSIFGSNAPKKQQL